jgi:hypothetical protein
MNTAITTTLISVLGAGLFGMFFVLFKNLSDMVANGFAAVETGFGRLEDRFGRLEDKVDGLVGEVHALEIKFTEKFTAELRTHSERLARIESKLEPDPPAEAA